jgi:uncharacterized protein YegJ (DUF2314 family)
MRTHQWRSIVNGILLVCLLFVGACSPATRESKPSPATIDSKPPAAAVAPPTAEILIPTGSLMDERIMIEFAIYYLPKPTKEPLAEVDSLLKDKFPTWRKVEKIDDEAEGLSMAANIESNPQAAYPPPNLKLLQYFGHGVDREQAEALQTTEVALILDFSYAKEHVWDGMRAALEFTHEIARTTEGLIWDNATRELFSSAAWKERCITPWTEPIPDISKLTVIHAYKKDEYVRAITLGMEKFGLPDIVVDNFSWSLNRNTGIVVNLFAQSIAEGAELPKPGEFDLKIDAIKHPKVREEQKKSLKPNATGVAPLTLTKGVWEEGDPMNRLIEIKFDRGQGPDIHAKQDHVISQAFGVEDTIVPVKHDEELLAASRKARTKLPELRAEFNKGLAPGEFILVKFPFPRPDEGNEMMWVEVTSWKGDKISGMLKNEPFYIPTLHAGQEVDISEAKVFDYIRKHADGASAGNETGKLIEKRSK